MKVSASHRSLGLIHGLLDHVDPWESRAAASAGEGIAPAEGSDAPEAAEATTRAVKTSSLEADLTRDKDKNGLPEEPEE